MSDDALAKAGRAGCATLDYEPLMKDQHYAALARAVLESLGIEVELGLDIRKGLGKGPIISERQGISIDPNVWRYVSAWQDVK